MATALGGSAQGPGNGPGREAGTEQGNANTAQNVQVPADLSRIARALEAQNTDEDAEREQRDLNAQEGMAWWAKWMFWAAAAQAFLSGVGIVLIYVTFQQTRRAADSADEIVTVTRDSVEQQLRAYLAIDGFRGDIKTEDGGFRVGLSFRFKNCGQTPALRIFSNFNIMLGPPPAVTDDFDFPPGKGGVGFGYMPAGMEHTSGVQWLSVEFTSDLLAKRRICMFYGYIDYDDVFEHTSRRRTEFCAEVELETGPGGVPVAHFATPRHHNAIDSDCRRQPDPW